MPSVEGRLGLQGILQLKKNPRDLTTIAAWCTIGFLAGCAGTPDPSKVAAEQHEGSSQILANKNKKGSLLLVRMVDSPLLGDVNYSGYITLRRINAGKPDETEPPVSVGSAVAYRLQNPNKLVLGQLFSATAQKYARWFVPVALVVTSSPMRIAAMETSR